MLNDSQIERLRNGETLRVDVTVESPVNLEEVKSLSTHITEDAIRLRTLLVQIEQSCRFKFEKPVDQMSIGDLVRTANALTKFKSL